MLCDSYAIDGGVRDKPHFMIFISCWCLQNYKYVDKEALIKKFKPTSTTKFLKKKQVSSIWKAYAKSKRQTSKVSDYTSSRKGIWHQ